MQQTNSCGQLKKIRTKKIQKKINRPHKNTQKKIAGKNHKKQ